MDPVVRRWVRWIAFLGCLRGIQARPDLAVYIVTAYVIGFIVPGRMTPNAEQRARIEAERARTEAERARSDLQEVMRRDLTGAALRTESPDSYQHAGAGYPDRRLIWQDGSTTPLTPERRNRP